MSKNFSKWPKGVAKCLTYPEVPLFQIIRSSAKVWPDRNAIVFAGLELTFRELDQLSDRFAAALFKLGVRKGDRVAIHLPNCPQFAVAYYGLLKAGAVFVPVSPLLAEKEFVFQLNDSGAGIYIGLDLLFGMPQKALPQTKVRHVILVSLADCYAPLAAPAKMLRKTPFQEPAIDFTALLSEHPPEAPEIEFSPSEDLAHISYTGGTTGTPKGVMVTHFNGIVASCQLCYWFLGGDVDFRDGVFGVKRFDGDREDDHVIRRGREMSLVVPPWFHAMGAFAFLNMQLMAGCTLIVQPRFDAAEFLNAIPKYGITIFGGAPQIFYPLVEHPLFPGIDMSGVRLIASGAAPISHDLLQNLTETMEGVICEAYGMTEVTVGCAFTPADKGALRIGSVGLPVQDTEIRIVNPEDASQEMPVGQIGEVCVKGPQVMKGYWNKPEETRLVLDDEGWLLSGDIGRFDEEGYLYIVDRKKDMLIYKGYNIYPRDLEEVLNRHPAVVQSAVVGKRDDRYGELPVAFVQVVPGEAVTPETLLEFANEQLAKYKKIRRVVIMEQLPSSAAGKILRRELRDRAQALDVTV
ncbi:MAG TPA: AMP-binding protein [Syntrophales bacterium]|nr:AMP-binding protein [Syntrophales bacterium]